MKKIILVLSLILISTIKISSQLTLTSTITPRPGDIQYRVDVDTAGIIPGNSGTNQTWNFTNITKIDSSVTQWISSFNTPYFNYFPASKISTLDTCYSYYDTSASKVEYIGQYSHGTAFQYTNFQTILSFPFTYNSVLNDTYEGTFIVDGDTIHRTGTVNVTGDATGTIFLPSGSFSNALRLKHIITSRDSSFSSQYVILTSYTVYDWYVPGKKFSVFSIVNIDINFASDNISFFFKNCTYNPASSPIGIMPVSNSIPTDFKLYQNYPNPFNPITKISFDIPQTENRENTKLAVYDMLGRETAVIVNEHLKPGSYEIEFNAQALSSGTYFIRLQTGKDFSIKKMMLIK